MDVEPSAVPGCLAQARGTVRFWNCGSRDHGRPGRRQRPRSRVPAHDRRHVDAQLWLRIVSERRSGLGLPATQRGPNARSRRGNAHGVDINRNFPAANFDAAAPSNGGTPLSQPESRALVETIDRAAPELVLVAHSWLGREFVNFDGPARAIAERFARTAGMPVEESSAFAPTPGSLGSYVGRDRGIAVVTIEVLRSSDPLQVWDKLRPALLEAIRGAQSS